MFLGEINLIVMQMFIVLLLQHGCCEHTLYILNNQIERNYVYWLLCFFYMPVIYFISKVVYRLWL